MKEIAYTINKQLVGVYTQSEVNKESNKLPTILFMNSGLLPHIGPYRLYVKLARKFAKLGFRSFRFDLSGIGDSEKHKDSRLHKLQHKEDIKDVIDFLGKEQGDINFVTLGICTGADNAHQTMARDERVVGAICVDGYTYPTKKYYFNLYAPKLLSIGSWFTMAKMIIFKLFPFLKPKATTTLDTIDMTWHKPPKEKVAKDYRDFIRRKSSLLCIFTASWPCNYKEQLSDVFEDIQFGDHLQTAYLEDAEHIFPLEEDRENLTKLVTSWLTERFSTV
ncbi:MAG: alpha/beta hydrolase [Kangiellaceae bacterium]|nr:alpha/beta hydrolase [Kangiellaceae bacterium]